MGIFHAQCQVINIHQQDKKVTVPNLLVDTGSECTWVPQELLKRIGVKVFKKDEAFLMANGETIKRPVGYALLRVGAFKTVDEVVFAQPGDLALLGSRTIEGFGAVVDPGKKRLVAGGPRPAAVTAPSGGERN
jgi:predicted aspartyl protease